MKQIRFCPNCGSTWVEPDISNRAEIAYSGGNPNKWKCNECNYTGLMPEGDPEEFDEDAEEIEFDPEDDYPREDIGFGKAYFTYLFYITLPVVIIYILYKLLI